MKKIKEQYEKWIYPEPVMDMIAAINNGYSEHHDIPLYGNMFWHDKQTFDGLEILVAGCGTNSAAYNAIRNPTCRVTGIDISQSSLDHERYLINKHKVQNLEIINLSIEHIASLDKKFDYILCSGVLHHLNDPEIGLRALNNVMKDDGVMCLMLYGETFRHGVYILQEVFRELGLAQTEVDITIAREIINSLPDWHGVKSYVKFTSELTNDAAFVDTFLNPVDRAYSVDGVFDLISKSNLEFIGWQDPLHYDYRVVFPKLEPLHRLLQGKSDREKFAVVEKLSYSRGTHRFIVCKKNYAVIRIKPDPKQTFKTFYPKIKAGIKAIKPASLVTNENAILQRSGYKFEVSFIQARILEMCNGRNSVVDIANILDVSLEETDSFIKDMYSFGHLLIRC